MHKSQRCSFDDSSLSLLRAPPLNTQPRITPPYWFYSSQELCSFSPHFYFNSLGYSFDNSACLEKYLLPYIIIDILWKNVKAFGRFLIFNRFWLFSIKLSICFKYYNKVLKRCKLCENRDIRVRINLKHNFF